MPEITLTDLTLKNLRPGAKRTTYIDRTLKGFGVMVMPSGHMSYVLTYGPNRQRVKLGDVGIVKLSEARAKARNLLAQRQLGVHAPSTSETYQDAVGAFLEAAKAKNKPRTHGDYTRLLKRHGFGQERLSGIQPKDIAKKLGRLPPGERAHAYVALNIFFRSCVRKGLVERNPMERVDRPAPGKKRARILTDDELQQTWHACQGIFGDIIKLCILLGQRRSEIAQLRWDWFQGDILTIPAEATKNKREHAIPVGPFARAVLEAQPRRNDTPYVFPARNHGRGKKAKFYGSWGKDKAALDKRCGVSGWVIHDLRRTFRSKWAQLRVPREVAEKYINHISGAHGGVDGIYDRYSYQTEMRAAALVWEEHLRAIVKV